MSSSTNTTATTTLSDRLIGLYTALAAGDAHAAQSALTDDVVIHVPGTHPLAGDHHGVAGLFGLLAGLRARADEGEDIEVLDVLAGAEHVAAYCRVTARRGERRLDNTSIHIARFEGERIAEVWLHNFDGLAVDEFWR